MIGVAFQDPNNAIHTQAAELSISEVPGTQVVFNDGWARFIGPDGFRRACQYAISGELPVITLPEPRPPVSLTLEQAIAEASKSG